MIITYFRSSSYNTWDICQQQYFIGYVLGIPEKTNKKAEKGTMVHKVMECLANMKKCLQDNVAFFVDDGIGRIDVTQSKMMNPEFVHTLCDASFYHYQRKSPNQFGRIDQADIHNWTFKALEFGDGIYDPRLRNIVEAEQHFDFVLEEDWAHYQYVHPATGETIEGQLAMKGTIDLITSVGDGVYEVIDWKTGRRHDWATDTPKTYDKLTHDPQLSIYHYALSRLMPEIETFIMTINFINDGGPFTLAYEKTDMPTTMTLIKSRMQEIQNTTRPRLKSVSGKHFFCNKICHYGKNPHPDNPEKTICRHIRDENLKCGLDEVVRKYTTKDFNVGHYENPGE